MASFGSLDEVHDVLAELATRAEPVVVELARRPGQKETRWAHLLGGEPSEETGDAPAADYESTARPVTASRSALEDRLAALEDRIESLEAELAELRGSR